MPVAVPPVGLEVVPGVLLVGKPRPSQLDQDAVRVPRMDEGFLPVAIVDRDADERNAVRPHGTDRGIDVGDLERDVMHAFASIANETRERSVRSEGRDELDLAAVRITELSPSQTRTGIVAGEQKRAAESFDEKVHRRSNIVHRNRDVIDESFDHLKLVSPVECDVREQAQKKFCIR